MDRRFSGALNDRDERIQIALAAAKEAVGKAEEANERRLALLNEFRSQQADEARKYAQIVVVDQAMDALQHRISNNESAIATLQGRSIAFAGFGALLGGTAVALITRAFGG